MRLQIIIAIFIFSGSVMSIGPVAFTAMSPAALASIGIHPMALLVGAVLIFGPMFIDNKPARIQDDIYTAQKKRYPLRQVIFRDFYLKLKKNNNDNDNFMAGDQIFPQQSEYAYFYTKDDKEISFPIPIKYSLDNHCYIIVNSKGIFVTRSDAYTEEYKCMDYIYRDISMKDKQNLDIDIANMKTYKFKNGKECDCKKQFK